MLTFALENDYIETHPLVKFSMLPEPQKAMSIPTTQEVRALVEKTAEYDRYLGVYVCLLAECGLRKSEGLRLEWKHIRDERVTLEQTKSGKVRHVPLTAYASDWLGRIPRIVGQVFLRPNGKPWKDLRGPIKKALKDLGLFDPVA